jgi:hypothetical protein
VKQYINDPEAMEFWDLNNEKIRKAHQEILGEFSTVMEALRREIKSGEFETDLQLEDQMDWSQDGDHPVAGGTGRCSGLYDLFYYIDRRVSQLYQGDTFINEVPQGNSFAVIAAITRAYIRLGADLYFVNPKINGTLRTMVEDNEGLILDDLALKVYQIAEYQASRNHKALPEMNKAELLRYLERLSIEEIRALVL